MSFERKAWEPEEDTILREKYGKVTNYVLARELKRTTESVKKRAQKLGLVNASEAKRIAAAKFRSEQKIQGWQETEQEIDGVAILQDVQEASKLLAEALRRRKLPDSIDRLLKRLEELNIRADKARVNKYRGSGYKAVMD